MTDRREYESQQAAASRQAVVALLEFVPMNDGVGPAVEFLCPRGHSLRSYRLVENWRGGVMLEPLPGESRSSGPVASNGSMFNNAKHVCDFDGCPTLVPQQGTCDEHGGRAAEVLHPIRTMFECQCGWADPVTHTRLLKVYGLAVYTKQRSIPITGVARATRRR